MDFFNGITKKKMLLMYIIEKGSCKVALESQCINCPLGEEWCHYEERHPTKKDTYYINRYLRAFKEYIYRWGKETFKEDLFEELL